jgi:hypothetical protein
MGNPVIFTIKANALGSKDLNWVAKAPISLIPNQAEIKFQSSIKPYSKTLWTIKPLFFSISIPSKGVSQNKCFDNNSIAILRSMIMQDIF